MEEATEKQIKFMNQLGIDWDKSKFISKNEAREVIQEAINKEDKPETVKVEYPKSVKDSKSNDIQVGVYTSYAKDIYCAITPVSDEDPKTRMETAIRLVKQAREAFE